MLRNSLGKIYRKKVNKELQSRIDCLRAQRYWRRTGVIFIHVPKAAGVTISTALYGTTLGHIAAYDVKNNSKKDFENLFCFSIVREPVARFYSAVRYLNKNKDIVRGGPGLPSDFNILRDPEKIIKWVSEQDLNEVNYVFRPQHLFICDKDGVVLPDYIGRTETFDDAVYVVEKKINRKIDVRRLNTTSESDDNSVFTRDLDNAIREVYKKDFEILGY